MADSAKKAALWQMLKFTLFSISAGVIQEVSFLLFYNVLHWSYWVAYLPSLLLSVLWNFTFNRRYTFRSSANVPKAMLLVLAFYAVFTPLSTWWGSALTKIGWDGNLVQILTMLVNFVTEFVYQRFVVFRDSIDTNDVAKKAAKKNADVSAQ